MNPTIDTAMKQGWKPQEPGKRETYFCEAGCGRSVTHFSSDPTCGYSCPYCREEASQFNAQKTREAKAAKEPK